MFLYVYINAQSHKYPFYAIDTIINILITTLMSQSSDVHQAIDYNTHVYILQLPTGIGFWLIN